MKSAKSSNNFMSSTASRDAKSSHMTPIELVTAVTSKRKSQRNLGVKYTGKSNRNSLIKKSENQWQSQDKDFY
jgi:hypothetical protein